MKQVADEHDLELFGDASVSTTAPRLPQAQRQTAKAQVSEEDEMMARLQALNAT